MARYIDADLLLSTLNENKIPYDSDINYFICHAPTANVVEVVRCKDCKYYVVHTLFGMSQGWCEFDKTLIHGTEEDDFCSRGKLK